MNNKPLIGITTDLKEDHNSIEESYSKAVAKYGGLPILIPTTSENKSYLEGIIERLDGLLIPGSRDMDPKFYNENPHPKIREMSLERTEAEFYVLKEALENKLSVLGICGGMQFINVFFGGSLYQDIESLVDKALDHEEGAVHGIEVYTDTKLHNILSNKKFDVKSYHHQAINKVGSDLNINAESPDGIIEGIESKNGFVLGIQWHPELEETETSKQIFENFIKECAVKK